MAITAFPLKRKFTESFNVYGLIPPTDFRTSIVTKFLGWFATIILHLFAVTLVVQLILTTTMLAMTLLGLGTAINLTVYQQIIQGIKN